MEHFTPVFVAIDGWDSAVLPWILRDWLYRLSRRRTYAFGFQNCLNKRGFRIAVGITITLVLVGQIGFQSRISRPGLHVSPQHIPEHDQRLKTRMIVLDYL